MRHELYRRRGRLVLSGDLLLHSSDPSLLLQLFGQVIVLQTNYEVYSDYMEYVALSPCFDEVAEGEMAPLYSVCTEVLPEGTRIIGWKREG